MFSSLHQIIMALVPVAFVIFLGWFAGYRKIIDNKHSHSLATYVMNFSFPCGLFILAATTKPSQLFNIRFVSAFWIGLMGMYLISLIVYKVILKRNMKESGQGAFVCAFPDMAFMGIPIFTSLLGATSLISIAIGNICTSLIMIPIVTIILSGKESGQSIGSIIINVIKKPLVFAPILGVIFSLLGLHLPDLAKSCLTMLSGTTSGVSLFTLGLIMSAYVVRMSKLVVLNIVLKNIIHPLIMIGLVMLFGVKGIYAKEAILLCAMPTATMTTMFGLKYKTLTEESTSSTILGTIVSLVTLTIFMLIVGIN